MKIELWDKLAAEVGSVELYLSLSRQISSSGWTQKLVSDYQPGHIYEHPCLSCKYTHNNLSDPKYLKELRVLSPLTLVPLFKKDLTRGNTAISH